MRKWFEMRAGTNGGAAEISIYGAIGKSWWDDEAVSAADFAGALKELGDVSEITLRLNSPGGDVFDGVTIHNLLKQHGAKVTCRVDGLAASAASLIAMAADEIIMPSNAFMLVHEPSGGAWGPADTMRAMAADLDRMTETFAASYAARSGMDVAAVKALMKEDRLVDATEAKTIGLCDALDEPVKMVAAYSLSLLPKAARARMEAEIAPPAEEKIEPANVAADAPEAGDNVVSLDAARATARDGAFAEAHEIADLCALAGLPQMAAGFIKNRSPVAVVRAALVDAKAKKDERSAGIVAAHAEQRMVEATSAWAGVIERQNSRVR